MRMIGCLAAVVLVMTSCGRGPGGDTALVPAPEALAISGTACGRAQVGNGVIVAPGIVATNAHIVAGTDRIEVGTRSGELAPQVVLFDPSRDLALLSIPAFEQPAETFAQADAGDVVVIRHLDDAGSTTTSTAVVRRRITATGDDIYGLAGARRRALELEVDLAAGDSGAGVFDEDGALVGLLFAVSTGEDSVAYALDSAEIDAGLDELVAGGVDVGPCR